MIYDVAVVGGGPAGLTASIFTTRAGLKTICFEKLAFGGQASLSYDISNYPAFNSISGFELTQKMLEQAKYNGTEFHIGSVEKVRKLKSGFSIKTKQKTFHSKKIILATGTTPRKLGLGEEKFLGKGISYCASCDGHFFKNKVVAVVGGGDSALGYVEYLSRISKKVYLINRTNNFKANPNRVEKDKTIKNVEIITNAQVSELIGDEVLSGIKLNTERTLKVEGLFVAIGHLPNLKCLDFEISLDNYGYIITNEYMQTSEKNVFACGDIVSKHFKQVITACADGAIAGNSCVGVIE